MAGFIAPQLARAKTYDDLVKKDWSGWFISPKHDGMRAVVVRTVDGVMIQSRTDKPYADHVPHLRDMFMRLPVGTVLDGELAIINEYVCLIGQDVPVVDFNKTMRIMGTGVEKAVDRQTPDSDNFIGVMQFIALDIMSNGTRNLVDEEQRERLAHLDEIELLLLNDNFIVNPEYRGNPTMIYDNLVAAGIEGIIMKDYAATYLPGRRNSAWLKVKVEKTFDVVVMGFTDAKEGKTGKWLGKIGAIEFGAYDPQGVLQYVGRCSGMDDETRDRWTKIRDDFRDMDVSFDDSCYVIEIKANELVGSGEYRTPRHPQYVTHRYDKAAKDCTMDQFKVES